MMTKQAPREDHIRIQKSRHGSYMQIVFVYFTKTNRKRQRYYSLPISYLRYYIKGTSHNKFLIADKMIRKDSAKYKEYQKQKALKKKMEEDEQALNKRLL